MNLRIAGIVDDSIVDGEGIRLTVFVQGRPHEPTMCDLEWKDYKQQMDKYDKKVQRGIDLFAEYYKGLWI